jgi:hypothetical protein
MNSVFTFTGFTGQYPVGTAAVVVAESLTEATDLLNERLSEYGLPSLDGQTGVNIHEVDLEDKWASILLDGEY